MEKQNEKSKSNGELLKVIPLEKNMGYHKIAEVIGNNLDDTMFDQISPVERNKFNAVAIKRKENQLIISYCRYDEFN